MQCFKFVGAIVLYVQSAHLITSGRAFLILRYHHWLDTFVVFGPVTGTLLLHWSKESNGIQPVRGKQRKTGSERLGSYVDSLPSPQNRSNPHTIVSQLTLWSGIFFPLWAWYFPLLCGLSHTLVRCWLRCSIQMRAASGLRTWELRGSRDLVQHILVRNVMLSTIIRTIMFIVNLLNVTQKDTKTWRSEFYITKSYTLIRKWPTMIKCR